MGICQGNKKQHLNEAAEVLCGVGVLYGYMVNFVKKSGDKGEGVHCIFNKHVLLTIDFWCSCGRCLVYTIGVHCCKGCCIH